MRSEEELPDVEEVAEIRRGLLARYWRRAAAAAAVVAAVVACGIGLFIAYYQQARTMRIAGDGGSQALQAWDMLHGNVLLHGWSLSDVTFYSTELPQYMLIELVRGLSGEVVHIAAALTYTLLVILVGWLAKGNATGRVALIRVLVASGIMLAPPLGQFSTTGVLLSHPDHTGTQVPLLLIWILLDRAKPRWWVPILVTVMLIWVQVGDALALYEGVVPIVALCAIRIVRRRRDRVMSLWYELSLAVGAVVSVIAATRILVLIRHVGGFVFTPPGTSFATVSAMTADIWRKVGTELTLFGANFFGLTLQHALVPVVHLVGVVLVIWAVAVALRRFTTDDSFGVQLLTVSFVVVFLAYTFGFRVGAWEAVGLLPIGAALAGRLLPDRITTAGLIVPLAAALASYCVFLGQNATAVPLVDSAAVLGNWLEAHDLHYGLADYLGQSITVETGNRVQVRPVQSYDAAFVVIHWNTDSSWYDPNLHYANFVIWRTGSRSLRSIYRAVGPPSKTYFTGAYQIMVWDKNLLDAPFIPGPVLGTNILAGLGGLGGKPD